MKLGKIKDIEIRLHFSTLLIVGFIGFHAVLFYCDLIPNTIPIWELFLFGIVNGLIMVFSILVHEIMHSIIAQRHGLEVSHIELNIFGGVSQILDEPKTPKSEMTIVAVGPISNLLLGVNLLVITFLFANLPPFVLGTCFYSGISNIGLAMFNLIPAFPIDGGRILRAFLWKKRNDFLSATRTTSKVGFFFGKFFSLFGFFQMIIFRSLNGLWFVLIGMFLVSSARKTYIWTLYQIKLLNIKIKDIIRKPERVIPFDTLITNAIKDYFTLYNRSYFPIVLEDKITGILHSDDIKRIPIKRRSRYIVGYAMKKISEFPSIYINGTGKDAMIKLIQMKKIPRIVGVKGKEEEEIIGIIEEKDLTSALKSTKILKNRYISSNILTE